MPSVKVDDSDGDTATFSIGPLPDGLGPGFAAALRRTLLSSLPGAAITSLRIEGVPHEFSSIPGVAEDVTDIVLNLKRVVCRLDGQGPVTAKLTASGPAEITAGDLELPASVEILNPDLHIAHIEAKTKLELEVTIAHGRGFATADANKEEGSPLGTIFIDSTFCPVRRVTFQTEEGSSGDTVKLSVETDGAQGPRESLAEAAETLITTVGLFTDPAESEAGSGALATPAEATIEHDSALDDVMVEELELGVRAYNCLRRAGVETLGDLVVKSRPELESIPNFGAKSIEEVLDALEARGLDLRDA